MTAIDAWFSTLTNVDAAIVGALVGLVLGVGLVYVVLALFDWVGHR